MGVWGVASGHAPPPLEPAEAPCHGLARRVPFRGAGLGVRAPLPGRNEGLKAPGTRQARKASPSWARSAIRQGRGASALPGLGCTQSAIESTPHDPDRAAILPPHTLRRGCPNTRPPRAGSKARRRARSSVSVRARRMSIWGPRATTCRQCSGPDARLGCDRAQAVGRPTRVWAPKRAIPRSRYRAGRFALGLCDARRRIRMPARTRTRSCGLRRRGTPAENQAGLPFPG